LAAIALTHNSLEQPGYQGARGGGKGPVDGTRIKAVNNKDLNFTRNSLEKFIKAADERLADYLRRLDEGDAAEKATSGARVKNLAEKIEALRKKRGQ
jgi:hypothetical protein